VATHYGPAIIIALRHADSKLEVRYPWCQVASLSPRSILRPGDYVQCQRFGRGIIIEAIYSTGFCVVKFAFGHGYLRVANITYDSNPDKEKYAGLLDKFGLGDPIITPFGPAKVLSSRCIGENRANNRGEIIVATMEWNNECSYRKPIGYVHREYANYTFSQRKV